MTELQKATEECLRSREEGQINRAGKKRKGANPAEVRIQKAAMGERTVKAESQLNEDGGKEFLSMYRFLLKYIVNQM